MSVPDKIVFEFFGFPKMGIEVYTKFRPFFDVLPRLNNALNGIIGAAYPNPEVHQSIILKLGELSMISMLELVALVGNGLGQGAFKILRSMLEYGINAEYLRRNPAEVQYYTEWLRVDQWKQLEYMRQHMPETYQKLSTEKIKQVEEDFIRVTPLFQYTNRAGNQQMRGEWCSLNLADRAARTDFTEDYKIIYPLASKLFHGALSGMAMHFDPNEDEHRLAVPPSLKWCDDSLIGGHNVALRMAKTLVETFDKDSSPPYAELEADYLSCWRQLHAQRQNSEG